MPMSKRGDATNLLAANLERLLLERQTTPVGLSLKMKRNRGAVRDILESRIQNPRLDTVEEIAKALNVHLTELFMTREQLEALGDLLREYLALQPEDQERLATVARALKKEA